MNEIRVVREGLDSAELNDLIRELDADLWTRYPTEQQEYSKHNKLPVDTIAVVAWLDGEAVGCGAFKPITEGDTVEIKRMFVQPAFRGQGMATKILAKLEQIAVEQGYHTARLETGNAQPEAVGLYEKLGFRPIPCFGVYAGMPSSLCFEKPL